MKLKLLITVTVVAVFTLVGFQAQALLLSPGDELVQGTDPKNPDAGDMESLLGISPLELLYKDNVGGNEEGPFAPYYETTYFNTPTDPQDALIEFVGSPGQEISCPDCFLLVKGGAAFNPIWYIFELVDESDKAWDGQEDIELLGFWSDQGAISHIQIVGKETPSVPEPAMLLLLGTCLIGLAGVRSIRKS